MLPGMTRKKGDECDDRSSVPPFFDDRSLSEVAMQLMHKVLFTTDKSLLSVIRLLTVSFERHTLSKGFLSKRISSVVLSIFIPKIH